MDIKPLFSTTLAQDMPAGAYPGQNAHPAGTPVAMANSVNSQNLGRCSFVGPDPVFFYLNIAEQSLGILLEKFSGIHASAAPTLFPGNPPQTINALDHNLVYEYMQAAIGFTIALFTAVEAFVNQNIPSNLPEYKITYQNGREKTFVDKEVFERKVSTTLKLKFLALHNGLADIESQPFWPHLIYLRELRHDLIHLKTKGRSTFFCYEELFASLFDADFVSAFDSLKLLFEYFDVDFFSTD